MKKEPIILIGGGGHCISCIDVVEQTNKFEIIGILDIPEKFGTQILNYSVIGCDAEISKFVKDCPNFLITVGQIKSAYKRISIYNQVEKAGGVFPSIISPNAYVSDYSKIGEGTIIMHHAFVNANTQIGKCSIINTKALIEHEAIIGDFVHISTGAIINGQANVGSQSFIGSNTVVANNINIPNSVIVSAGSQVMKNLMFPGTYIGNPLRKINKHR